MTLTTFNFPNGIDNFEPVLINDLTVVNADHVQDLRISVLEIENALIGVTNIPYVGTTIVQSTDNITRAIEKLDANLTAILVELGFLGDGYEGYASRLDALEDQLIAHRDSTGPVDSEGYGVHGVVGNVVGTQNVQILLNKKLDTGTDPSLVGPKIVIRATAADPGLRQLEIYDTSGSLSAWIDEAGNAFFAGDITVLGDEIVQDIQVVQSHLIVDGYTILGNPSQLWPTTINGNLTANNTSTTFNSGTFTVNGATATMGNGAGTLSLNYATTNIAGDLVLTNGSLSVAGLTSLGDGSGDPLTVTGDMTVSGFLEVQADARLYSNVYLGNNLINDTLTINVATLTANVGSGEVTFNANLNVSGNILSDGTDYRFGNVGSITTNTIELNGNVTVGGATLLSDDVTITGTLNVSEDIIGGNDLSIPGSVTLGSGATTLQANMSLATFTGSGSFGNTLIVGSSTTLGSSVSDTHTITGNTTVVGDGYVSGNVYFGGGFQDNTYNGSNSDHGGVTVYANGDVALDGKLTVKGPIDPISLIIVADASQETSPLKIFPAAGNPSPSYRVDLSGNTYSEGFLRYNDGGYLGPNGEFLKALSTEFTVGKPTQRPTATIYATSIEMNNSGLFDVKGNTKLGSNGSNTHTITGDTFVTGVLSVTGTINGVNLSNFNQAFEDHLLGIPYPAHDATQVRFTDNITNIGERPIRDALEIVAGSGWDSSLHDSLIEHLLSTTAHEAQNIVFSSSGFPLVTNTKEAILALAGSGWQLGVDATLKQHLDSATAHDATEVVYVPVPNSALTSVNTQGALQQASVILDQAIIVDQESIFRTNLAPKAKAPVDKTILIKAAPRGVFVHAQTRTIVSTDQTVSFAAAPATGYTVGTPYRRAGVALRANGTFAVNYSAFAASVAALTDPFWEAGTLPIAVVNLFFNSGTAGDIANITSSSVLDVRTLPMGTTGGPIVGTSYDVPTAQSLSIGTTVGPNTIFLGVSSTTVNVPGALEIQGITGGTLFQASNGFDTDTVGGTLGLGETANEINLGRPATLTYAEGSLTVEQTIRTNTLDVLSAGNNLSIGSSVGSGTITIGDGTTTTYIPGDEEINGHILFTGSSAIIDVDTAKPMAIGASVGANNLTLGGNSTQIVFLGSPLLKQTLKFEDPGLGTNTATMTAPTLGSNINLTLPAISGTIALTTGVPEVFQNIIMEPTGYENRTDSEISFDNGTRTFTIQPKAPALSFSYWIKGVQYTKTTAQTVVVPNIDGLYFIYFDGATLVADIAPPDLSLYSSTAFTAVVYWDVTGAKATIFGDERHGMTMDWKTHEYLHETEGTRYQDGLQIVNFTLAGSPALETSAQFGITGGRIKDEDLTHTIVHSPVPVNQYEQNIAVIARLPVLYRSGPSGIWRRDTATVYPLKTSAGTIQYNEDPGAGWVTTAAPEDSFVAMWVLATNDISEPIMVVTGQRYDTTLAAARENNDWNSMDMGQLPTPEARLLYRVIYQTNSGYGNSPNAVLMEIADYRTVPVSGAGLSASSDHAALGGLEKDTHDQYVNKYGRAGGQSVYGGTAASDSLTLRSTSNATKGQVVVDETTVSTSPTTGAFTVVGGAGIQGNLSIGGAQYVNYGSTVTSNYAVSATDFVIPVNTSSAVSNIVITLPAITAGTRGRLIVVKDVGGATAQLNKAIVIQGSGGNTIDGATSVVIDTEYFALTLVSNGATNWSII